MMETPTHSPSLEDEDEDESCPKHTTNKCSIDG